MIDFLFGVYYRYSILEIILEIIAALFGVISVFFARKENILVYPTGIISTFIYIFLLFNWQIYGDAIINIYYTIMSVIGWILWLKIKKSDNGIEELKISNLTKKDIISSSIIFIFTSIFVTIIYLYNNVLEAINVNYIKTLFYNNLSNPTRENINKLTPFLDIFTTSVFFIAMWQMANKKISHWKWWIYGNIVSIPLYIVKGFTFTAIQYSIFLILAIIGMKEWKLKMEID